MMPGAPLAPAVSGRLPAALLPMGLALGLALACAGADRGGPASSEPADVSPAGSSPGTGPAAPATRDAGGDPYVTMVLQDTQGRAIPLSQFAGKVRLFDIWASWCGPCRMGIPHLNRLYDRYRDRGLVVIGISVDDRPADVVTFTRGIPIRYPSGMMNPQVEDLLGYPEAVPTSYLVDRTGRLRRKFLGYVEPGIIEREVLKFLPDGRQARAGP